MGLMSLVVLELPDLPPLFMLRPEHQSAWELQEGGAHLLACTCFLPLLAGQDHLRLREEGRKAAG